MRHLHGIDAFAELPPSLHGGGLTIGNFDGVHVGHRAIIDALGDRPKVVVAFEPHPLTVFRPEAAPPTLSPLPLKRRLLEDAGVDALVTLPPTDDVLKLTAGAFWDRLMPARPAKIVEGADFHFGHKRGGDVRTLRRLGAAAGVEVQVVPPVERTLCDLSIVSVGSGLIRWLLAHGRVRDAAILLGRPHRLTGTVVRGDRRGRTIGFPTANLDVRGQLVPPDGTYAGRCLGHPAAVNVGTPPSFAQARGRRIEAHLIGFDGDLYGRELELELTDWLRPQVRFGDVAALKAQLGRDIARVRGA